MKRTSPNNVILDMLRSARRRQRSARSLISTGALFGHTENTMRVSLSRLTARGLVESPERGLYRLATQTDSVNDFVERWRLGEARIRKWQTGSWLLAHVESSGKDALWALDALGFRPVRKRLFTRPDNLDLSLDALRKQAAGIGLSEDVLLLASHGVENARAKRWVSLWEPRLLDTRYRAGIEELAESTRRLHGLALDDARLESFTLGGKMIHLLAKDPLLPEGTVDVEARRGLWLALLDYDALGKEIWAGGKDEALRHMPRPQLSAAG